jgi:hypothetical protein
MGGAVFITSGTLLPTSTRAFDYLIERLRPHLRADVVASAYAPMDEGGMTFISFESLGSADFQHVLKVATELSHSESAATPESPYLVWWDRLLQLLRADVRATS